jgi:chromosome segregation ATPase
MTTEALPEETTLSALQQKHERLTAEIKELRAAVQAKEAEAQALETEAIEAAALQEIGEGTKKDAKKAKKALQTALAEADAMREELKAKMHAESVIEDRIETAEQEALQAKEAALKEHVQTHCERVAKAMNDLGDAMQGLKEANIEWANVRGRIDSNPYKTPPTVYDADLLPYQSRNGQRIGETKVSSWFKRAQRAGFDVEQDV